LIIFASTSGDRVLVAIDPGNRGAAFSEGLPFIPRFAAAAASGACLNELKSACFDGENNLQPIIGSVTNFITHS